MRIGLRGILANFLWEVLCRTYDDSVVKFFEPCCASDVLSFSRIFGGGKNSISVSTDRERYRRIIFFASKKPHSCRNIRKNLETVRNTVSVF